MRNNLRFYFHNSMDQGYCVKNSLLCKKHITENCYEPDWKTTAIRRVPIRENHVHRILFFEKDYILCVCSRFTLHDLLKFI